MVKTRKRQMKRFQMVFIDERPEKNNWVVGRPEKDGVSSTSADRQQGIKKGVGHSRRRKKQLQICDCWVDVGLECRF